MVKVPDAEGFAEENGASKWTRIGPGLKSCLSSLYLGLDVDFRDFFGHESRERERIVRIGGTSKTAQMWKIFCHVHCLLGYVGRTG